MAKLRDSLPPTASSRPWREHLEITFELILDEEVGAWNIRRQRENELEVFLIATVLAIVEALDAQL